MPADQLLAAVLGDVGQRARAALLEQQREEVDLEEDVAELVEQLGVVTRVGGRGELVGLLDRVRDDRALVLLAVPGALAPQPPGQLVEAPERLDVVIGSRAQRAPAGSAAAGWWGAAGRRGRRRRRLRSVLALLGHVALAALGAVLPLLLEVRDELVERLLLVLRLQRLADRLLRLLLRLLRGLLDLLDLEHVVAELRLHRADDLAALGGEDTLVERLLERALGLRGQLAALRLGGLVDRVLLRDVLPRLAALERGLGLLGLRLALGEHDPQVTPLGLGEALLVLVVEVLDLGVGDLVLALDHVVADLVGQQVELDALHHVLLGLAVVLEELRVVGFLREALLLLLVERLLDLGVRDLDAELLGLALDPLERRQELEHLVAQLLVLLLALLLELLVGLLGLALGRLRRGLLLVLDALGVLRRVGHGGVGLAAGLGRDRHPVLEVVLLDRGAVDLGDGVAGYAAAPGGDHGSSGEGAERQEKSSSLSHEQAAGGGTVTGQARVPRGGWA